VFNLGNSSTNPLLNDLAAQFAGWTVTSGGKLAGTFDVTHYLALNGVYESAAPVAGALLEATYTGASLPANAHWIQVISTNYNRTGYTDVSIPFGAKEPDGTTCSASGGCWVKTETKKEPGQPGNYVDVDPGDTTPFYDNNTKHSTPPDFHDRPTRPDPTAANPTINWSAQLFLVSQTGANAATIYGGLEWGWDAAYSPKKSTLPPPAPIYDVSASGTTFWGLLTVTGWMGGGNYDFTVGEGGPGGIIYNFSNETGLTVPSQLPPPKCYTYPCNVTGPYTAQLVPTGNPSSGIISFGFEDQGETFSATGTLTPVTSATEMLGLMTAGVTAGVPEPSTWVMLLLGFGSLGFAGFRRTDRKA
jgi:hypothetical protein